VNGNKDSSQNCGVLRRDIKLFPCETPGNWTLFDPVADRYFRLGDKEYSIISRLHNNIPTDTLCTQLSLAGITVSPEDLKKLLGFLSVNGLMQPVYGLTEKRVLAGTESIRKAKQKQLLSAWLFFKIPLISPDGFLSATWPTVRTILNKNVLWLFGLLALIGYLLIITRWHQLTSTFISTMTGGGLLRYGLAIIITKAVHELAHAYAAKSAGVRVRRFGVGIMVFVPRLYTDITDSWRIKDRKSRMLIDGAGMGLELLIGGVAALIWSLTSPGTLNSICYYLFAVTSLNTLLINGNPLLRFDGYYLLMDGIGIDNLYSRGTLAVQGFMRRFFFGIQPEPDIHGDKKTTEFFLVLYGVSTFFYRIFLYTSILLIIYFKFTKGLALMLIALELYVLMLRPMFVETKVLIWKRQQCQAGRATVTLLMLFLLLGALLVPLPWNLEIGYLVRANNAQVLHVAQEGYLEKLLILSNNSVKADTPLYSMANPQLVLKRKRAELTLNLARLEEDQLRNKAGTIGLSRVKQQHKKSLNNLLTEIDRKISLLAVTAPMDGILWWYKPDDMIPGRWLAKGEPLGEIFSDEKLTLIGCLPEYELEKVYKGQKARIFLPDRLGSTQGTVIAVNPAPVTKSGPSPLLSVFGGPIQVVQDREKFRILKPYYEVIIKPEDSSHLSSGRTGTVRIRRYSSISAGFVRMILQIIR